MRSILLIDDDDDDRSLFKEALSIHDKSIQCWTANDGQQGLELLTYELVILPDLIFLDLNMPKMNGIDFLKNVKSNRGFKTIPVVMYTTSSHPADVKKTKELGAIDYLTKPSDFNELYKKIVAVLNKHSVPSYLDSIKI